MFDFFVNVNQLIFLIIFYRINYSIQKKAVNCFIFSLRLWLMKLVTILEWLTTSVDLQVLQDMTGKETRAPTLEESWITTKQHTPNGQGAAMKISAEATMPACNQKDSHSYKRNNCNDRT